MTRDRKNAIARYHGEARREHAARAAYEASCAARVTARAEYEAARLVEPFAPFAACNAAEELCWELRCTLEEVSTAGVHTSPRPRNREG